MGKTARKQRDQQEQEVTEFSEREWSPERFKAFAREIDAVRQAG